MFAATLVCGSMLFTACSNNDDPTPPPPPGPTDIDLKDPLTIEAVEDGEIDITMEVILPEPVYYSVNGGEKQEVSLYDPHDPQAHPYTKIAVKVGDKVQLFSRNTTLSKDRDNNNGFYISFESECYVYGNVMSMISPDDNWKDNKEIKEPYALEMLFCYTNIVTHPTRHLRLPATKLSKGCYVGMFNSSWITDAPELPATQLAELCYARMFADCPNLKKSPKLPATQLAPRCYYYMFWACRGLTEASDLPAMKLEEECYAYMFCWCEALTKGPKLPATTMVKGCYSGMFTETGLTKAPELPATQLAESCYEAMFAYCDDLIEATSLPAAQLKKRCYSYMFTNCSNLASAIELPAEQLPERCYNSMFFKCFKLSSVKCLATTMTGDFALMSWLKYAGTDESVSTRTLTHASETPWVNSDENQATMTDWFAPTDWTLVSQ